MRRRRSIIFACQGFLSALAFFLAVWLEYAAETRYSRMAMGSVHAWVGASGGLVLIYTVGVLWERMENLPGHWVIGCLVAAGLLAVGGYQIEQAFHHAARHSEKSTGEFIVLGCGILAITAVPVTAMVVRYCRARETAFHRS